MNKLIFFLLLSLSFGACKNESKEMKSADEANVEMGTTDAITLTEAPTLSDPAAQEYVKEYDTFLAEYTAAVESKDQVKLQELGTKMITLSSKGTEALANLTGDDAVKLTEYIKMRANEFARISGGAK